MAELYAYKHTGWRPEIYTLTNLDLHVKAVPGMLEIVHPFMDQLMEGNGVVLYTRYMYIKVYFDKYMTCSPPPFFLSLFISFLFLFSHHLCLYIFK